MVSVRRYCVMEAPFTPRAAVDTVSRVAIDDALPVWECLDTSGEAAERTCLLGAVGGVPVPSRRFRVHDPAEWTCHRATGGSR